ncbi:MAG: hypothetical protein AAF944_26850 [Bacteroidota bacterium]
MISSLHLNEYLNSPSASIEDVIDYLSDLFTELVDQIISEVGGEDVHELRAEARFLFGGWDWKHNAFRVWRLYYKKELEGFVFDELTADATKKRFYTFLGEANHTDIEEDAKKAYKELIFKEDKQDDPIDMEPLRILKDISLNKGIREVDGSLQIAKIYQSNRTEFFGIYWESSKGKPCFQGREYNEINKPLVRYFDPDTFEVLESDLPNKLSNITEEVYQDDCETVRECYDDKGHLKDALSEKQKHTLRLIFKEVAYRQFIAQQEVEDAQPEINEDA